MKAIETVNWWPKNEWVKIINMDHILRYKKNKFILKWRNIIIILLLTNLKFIKDYYQVLLLYELKINLQR